MLDQINGRTITIDTIDSIPIDCGVQIVRLWQLEIAALLKQIANQKL